MRKSIIISLLICCMITISACENNKGNMKNSEDIKHLQSEIDVKEINTFKDFEYDKIDNRLVLLDVSSNDILAEMAVKDTESIDYYGEIHDGYAIVKSSYNEAVDNSRQKNGVVISTMTSMAKEAYQYIEYDNNLKVKNVIDIKAMIPEELMKEIQECQSQAVAAPSGNELAWSTESGIYVLNLETQELMHHEPEADGYSQYEIAFIDENKLGFYKSKGDEIIDTKYGYWSLISNKLFYDEQRCYSPNQIRVSGNYLILNDGENPLTDTSSGKVVIYNCEENQSVVFKVDNTESTFSYITKDGAYLIAYTCINDNLTKHRVRVYQLSDKKCISENTFETEVGVQFYDFRNNENGYWLIGNEDTKRVVYNVFTTQ